MRVASARSNARSSMLFANEGGVPHRSISVAKMVRVVVTMVFAIVFSQVFLQSCYSNGITEAYAEASDSSADWPCFANGGAAVSAPCAVSHISKPAWMKSVRSSGDWSSYASDPVLARGCVYVASGSMLWVFDAKSGAEKAQVKLEGAIDSVSRMLYADGVLVVPIGKGRLQAVDARSLKTLWVTDAVSSGSNIHQSLSTLLLFGDSLVYATVRVKGESSDGGFVQCVSMKDGSLKWSVENESCGYYWAGAVKCGNFVVIGSDDGTVESFAASTGKRVGSCKVSGAVRSTLAADGPNVYAVSRDGVLSKLSIASDGALSVEAKVVFAKCSTSSPVFVDGKVIVGGLSSEYSTGASQWDKQWHGVIAVVDKASMRVESSVTSVFSAGGKDAAPLVGEVKATPSIVRNGGDTYVYVTANRPPGGVYAYRIGDEAARSVYLPEGSQRNYCMGSVAVAQSGMLYYVNDSGTLFALPNKQDAQKQDAVSADAGDSGSSQGSTAAKGDGSAASSKTQGKKADSKKTASSASGKDKKSGKAAEAKAAVKKQTGSDRTKVGSSASGTNPSASSKRKGAFDPSAPPDYEMPDDGQDADDGSIDESDDEDFDDEEADGEDAGDEADEAADVENESDETADEADSSDGKGEAQSDSEPLNSNASEQLVGAFPWAAVGLGVGLIGLAGAGAYWLVVSRRSKQGEEDNGGLRDDR